MMRRTGLIANRKEVRRHMKALNPLHRARKRFKKSVQRTMVVSRTNIFRETDNVYMNKEG
ncbi:MAG: hypothetical protein QXQ46_09490 [Thermoplasmatales archaeon]